MFKKSLSALIALLMLAASAAFATPVADTPAPAATARETVADFEVALVTGETFRLSDYAGKIVVVDLWATWCPPCVASMPYLQQLSEEYADQVVILGVNCGDKAATVQSFVADKGYTFPIAIDEDLDILYNYFYTDGIPYTVFIDTEGNLAYTHLGGGDAVYQELKEIIDTMIAELPESAAPTAAPAN